MDDKQLTAVHEKDYGINTLAELWKRGIDVDNGPADRPRKPFSQVPWVYVCVNKILDTAGGIGLVLSTLNDDVVESGPAYDFLFANDKMPIDEFLSQTIGYVSLFKECYWVYIQKDRLAPTDILVVGPDQLKPVLRNGVLVGYELRLPGGNRIPLFEEDVHPLIGFNPDSGYRGIGPLLAGAVSISSSYQAALYNESSLANGARISTVLTVPAGIKLSDDEIALYKSQFKATHGGARNAGKTFLATGGVDVKTLSQTMAELQMIDLRRFDAAEICALFGVPPEIVGLNSEAQYAHGPASQRFITDTVAPMLAFIARHITSGILQQYRFKSFRSQKDLSTYTGKAVPFAAARTLRHSRMKLAMRPTYRDLFTKAASAGQNLFAWFSIEDHPAIQEMLRARAEKMMEYVDKGVPLNQVIDAGDLPFEHVPWGDDWWISAGMVTARMVIENGMESVTGPAAPEAVDDETAGAGKNAEIENRKLEIENKDSAQQKLRIWQKWVTSWQQLEKEYISRLRLLFAQQQRELLAKLAKALESSPPAKGESGKAGRGFDRLKADSDLIARIVFDLKKENGKLKVINDVFFEKASALGAAQTINEVQGLTGDALKEAVKRVKLAPVMRRSLQISSHKIQGVNATTQARVARQMTAGLESGEGLNELSKRIRSVLGDARKRTLHIARTQTAGAVSTGRQAGMQASGVELKGWLNSHDTVVRKSHQQAETAHKAGIPIDQPFWVGGEALMYPADPGGSAGNIINCRCLQIAIKAKGKTFDLAHYDRAKFMDYSEFKTLFNEV
ncbi:MAG: phage portal protein [Patescibacteria group bacterium]